MIWVQLQRPLAVGLRFFEFAHLPEDGSPPIPAFGISGVFAEELIEDAEGGLMIVTFGSLVGRFHHLERVLT